MNPTIRHTVAAVVATAAAVALSGCGNSGSSGSNNSDSGMPGMPGMSSTSSSATAPGSTAAVHNQADVTFATNMIPHHEQAVAMAEMALKQASNAQVKALATEVKSAQEPEIKMMAGWLSAWGQPVPTGMPGMSGHDMSGMAGMDGMMSEQEMSRLQGASGAGFDRMWLQMMTKHHQGAVTMATTETQQGANPDATALAQQIITAQNKEIAAMAKLLPTITG